MRVMANNNTIIYHQPLYPSQAIHLHSISIMPCIRINCLLHRRTLAETTSLNTWRVTAGHALNYCRPITISHKPDSPSRERYHNQKYLSHTHDNSSFRCLCQNIHECSSGHWGWRGGWGIVVMISCVVGPLLYHYQFIRLWGIEKSLPIMDKCQAYWWCLLLNHFSSSFTNRGLSIFTDVKKRPSQFKMPMALSLFQFIHLSGFEYISQCKKGQANSWCLLLFYFSGSFTYRVLNIFTVVEKRSS